MPATARNGRTYGHKHRQTRARLLPAAIGTPCPAQTSPRCTGIMTDPALMDLDHSTPVAHGGTKGDRIICSPCNRGAGAAIREGLHRPPERRATRIW